MMQNKLILISMCSVGALAFGSSSTQDRVRFGYDAHTLFSHVKRDDTAKRHNSLLHEAHMRVDYKAFAIGTRFVSQLTDNPAPESAKHFQIEKKYIDFAIPGWKFTAGDSYEQFGKGIALSLYRETAFGIDTTLEGFSVNHEGSRLQSTVFGGRINAQKIPVSLNPVPYSLDKRNVFLAGGSLAASIVDDTKAGVHYLFSMNKPHQEPSPDKYWNTAGMFFSVDNIVENVDGYVETNALFTRVRDTGSLPTGWGSYGALSLTPVPWLGRMEVIDYRQYQFEFQKPPTLEEDIIETTNTKDVTAVRLLGEHRNVDAKSAWIASYLVGDDRIEKTMVHHGVIGHRFGKFLSASGEVKLGYRNMPANSQLAHASIKLKWPTFKAQSLEFGARKQWSQKSVMTLLIEDRNLFDLTYGFSENTFVTLGYEFIPTNEVALGQHFASVGATIKWGRQLVTKAFIGTTSGGTQCSGGICRRVSPYSGGMVEAIYRL